MSFDFGEVFIRAWQITWKNKVLWGISVLPVLISFLVFPLWLILVFTQDFEPDRIFRFMENSNIWLWLVPLYGIVFGLSLFLQILSRSSVTLGVYRAEVGSHPLRFTNLLKDGMAYFWRFLGVSLLLMAAMLMFFLVLFAGLGLLSVVTMGLAVICIQPLFLLLIPLILLLMAFMEQAEAAIIADGMGVLDSIRQAYELVRAHIWKYVVITLAIYVGMSLLMSLFTFPFLLPVFFIMMNNLQAGADFNLILKWQAVFGMVLLPLIALIQGFVMAYTKSAMMVTYLRLRRAPRASRSVLQQATI